MYSSPAQQTSNFVSENWPSVRVLVMIWALRLQCIREIEFSHRAMQHDDTQVNDSAVFWRMLEAATKFDECKIRN